MLGMGGGRMGNTEPGDPLPCARLRLITLVVALTCFILLLVAPLVVAVAVLILKPLVIAIPVALIAVVFVAAAAYLMSSSNQWVELDGGIIRCRRLLTRKVVELKVSDIVNAQPIHTNYLSSNQNAFLDDLLETSNRGYQLFFRDGTRLPLIRLDMSGLDEFLGALAEQMPHNRQESSPS